jgi:hypothetical protein
MVLILLRMRCSEAEFERVFARLHHLFGDYDEHTQDDLVESRLTITMNNLNIMPDFVWRLSQMEGDVLGA